MTADANKKKSPRGTFDKSILFEDHRETREVDVPPYGTFKIRAVSRAEALAIYGDKNPLTIEQALISAGCIDPVLSRNEVKKWQEVSQADALTPLIEAISDLSGLDEEVEKEAVERFPEKAG